MARVSRYRDLFVIFVICAGHARRLRSLYPIEKQIGRQLWRSDHVAGQSRFEAKTPQQSRACFRRGRIVADAGGRSVGGRSRQPTADMTGRHAPGDAGTYARRGRRFPAQASRHSMSSTRRMPQSPHRGPRFAMASRRLCRFQLAAAAQRLLDGDLLYVAGHRQRRLRIRPVRPVGRHKYARPSQAHGSIGSTPNIQARRSERHRPPAAAECPHGACNATPKWRPTT